jgi:hypothetical protein
MLYWAVLGLRQLHPTSLFQGQCHIFCEDAIWDMLSIITNSDTLKVPKDSAFTFSRLIVRVI